jgi:hypothetical protein
VRYIRRAVAGSSSDAFEDNERPTARRDRPEAIDLANSANKTQELNPRQLLGAERLDREATSETPRAPAAVEPEPEPVETERAGGTAATESTPSAEPTDEARVEPRAQPASLPPLPVVRPLLSVTWHEGRVAITPTLLAIVLLLALIAGFVAARIL